MRKKKAFGNSPTYHPSYSALRRLYTRRRSNTKSIEDKEEILFYKKCQIHTLPYRQINKYYRKCVSAYKHPIILNGLIGENYIFLGHETVLVIDSMTYTHGDEKSVETLIGQQRHHHALCIPFKKPNFQQFLHYFTHNFIYVKSKNTQLEYLVEAFSQCRKFLNKSAYLESPVETHTLDLSDVGYSPINFIRLYFKTPSKECSTHTITFFNPLHKALIDTDKAIQNIEKILAEYTHLFLGIHIEYQEPLNFCQLSTASSLTSPTSEITHCEQDNSSTLDNYIKNHKDQRGRLDFPSKKKNKNGNRLINPSWPTKQDNQTHDLYNQAIPLQDEPKASPQATQRLLIIFHRPSQSWCTAIPKFKSFELQTLSVYPSLSLGFFTSKIMAFRRALRWQSLISPDQKSACLKRPHKISLYTLTKGRLQYFNKRKPRQNRTTHTHQHQPFKIPINPYRELTHLRLTDTTFFYTTCHSFKELIPNLTLKRHFEESIRRRCLRHFLRTMKKRQIDYMHRTARDIRLPTKQIILAKRKREETFYHWRRKPPMDKFDPEMIASQVLNKDGILLRHVQDLSFYQKQVMYKECLHRKLQAPIYLGWNAIKEKGRSVYAAYRIEKGEFVLEYKGELIDHNEYQRREKCSSMILGCLHCMSTFIFGFKINGKMWYIDATSEDENWGAGRLINHSHLKPNLSVCSVYLDGVPRLYFYARREVQMGEELLVDYGEQDPSILNSPHFHWLKEN